MPGETALDEGWARYTTDQLERLLERLLAERGVPLPSVIADLRNEIARRRDGGPRPGEKMGRTPHDGERAAD